MHLVGIITPSLMDIGRFTRYLGRMIDTRFSTALQILIVVAINDERNVRSTSNTLAVSLNTNASFVRKMLARLREANIVSSSQGNGGGVKLACSPNLIKLDQVYKVMMAQSKLLETRTNIAPRCAVTEQLAHFSESLFCRAETAVTDMLSGFTLQNSIDELLRVSSTTRASAHTDSA